MTTHHNTQSLQGNSPNRLDDIRAALIGQLHFNTEPEDIELPRIKRRAQYIHDITQHDFDWFVTLTFRYKKTDHDEVVLLAKKFFDSLSRGLYGKRSKKRIIHYSAIERHKDGSYHIHAVIKQPKPDSPLNQLKVQDLIKRNWYEVTSTNLNAPSSRNVLEKSWSRPINSSELFDVARYITKDCYRHNNIWLQRSDSSAFLRLLHSRFRSEDIVRSRRRQRVIRQRCHQASAGTT